MVTLKNAMATPRRDADKSVTLQLRSEHGHKYTFKLPRAAALMLSAELQSALKGFEFGADT